jgi:mRNA-degrading endonuclease RelE of RelBE toxin-antitoxin system
MTSDEAPPPELIRYTPEFKRNLRQLARKYRRIESDVQPLLDSVEQGQTPGDQIPNVQYDVFKVRLSNSDSGKGKSGGNRVIYQRDTDGSGILITIYSKTEQEDISPNEIRTIIVGYDKPSSEVQTYNRGDAFFTGEQNAKLQELKHRLDTLTPEERQELEALVEASFDATIPRTQSLPPVKA